MRKMTNLKPFKKGQSGNPKGRPKGARDGLRAHLNRVLQKTPDKTAVEILKELGVSLDDESNAEGVAYVLLRKALQGDIQAIKLIFDQTEQPLKQNISLETKDPVQIYLPDNGRSAESGPEVYE
ncbi:MAG: hypothetical protein HZA02_08525 [Nitrospinae bacterium]|nr:hypothetical protein [Nitrospinota bacterium]